MASDHLVFITVRSVLCLSQKHSHCGTIFAQRKSFALPRSTTLSTALHATSPWSSTMQTRSFSRVEMTNVGTFLVEAASLKNICPSRAKVRPATRTPLYTSETTTDAAGDPYVLQNLRKNVSWPKSTPLMRSCRKLWCVGVLTKAAAFRS